MDELKNLKRKVTQYQEVVENTNTYRATWKESLKKSIVSQLENMIKEVGLTASVEIKDPMVNMEAIVLSLGESQSGISEKVNKNLKRPLIKHNGSLVYQQLFNGKIIVLINAPVIEGYGKPQPPKTIAIYRPEEIKPPFLIRHMEELLKEVTNWEDYDDDDPGQKIGFNHAIQLTTPPEIEGEE